MTVQPGPSIGGFGEQPFRAVVREERFFCFLLAHSLLSSRRTRTRFTELAQTLAPLDADALDVFVEATVMRDYWRALGNPVGYTATTHEARRAVLVRLLEHEGVLPEVLDQHAVFWTGAPGQPGSKLWSPGRWDSKALAAVGVPGLIRLRYAFNAKPDLMLSSPGALLFIEAKVESGQGVYAAGETQYGIQRYILELIDLLLPEYQTPNLGLTTLTTSGPDMTWADIAHLLEPEELDGFTIECLRRIGGLGAG